MIYSRMIMERELRWRGLENYSAVNDSAETGEDGRMIERGKLRWRG